MTDGWGESEPRRRCETGINTDRSRASAVRISRFGSPLPTAVGARAPQRAIYSARSASTGFTRVARRAGSQHASAVTARSSAATPAMVGTAPASPP